MLPCLLRICVIFLRTGTGFEQAIGAAPLTPIAYFLVISLIHQALASKKGSCICAERHLLLLFPACF